MEECNPRVNRIYTLIKKSEIKCFYLEKNDDLDIYLEIQCFVGGVESQDWADMLRRMYIKWFDKKF